MTVTTTFDAANARVAIDADNLNGTSYALVERSVNGGISWTTVRSAAEYPITEGSLLLDAAGEHATVPDSASLDIVGDIDIRADITPAAWTAGVDQTIVAKFNETGNQRSYMFFLSSDGFLQLRISTDGAATQSGKSTEKPLLPASGRLAVRATLDVDNGAAGKTYTFYTGPTIEGPWTQLGDTVTFGGVVAIFSSTSSVFFGQTGNGSVPFTGRIHLVQIRAGINGTRVLQVDFRAQAGGTTSFTAEIGGTVTLQGTATIPEATFVDTLYDYEYVPCVENLYRVRGVNLDPLRFLVNSTASTAGSSNGAPLATNAPAGTVPGDMVLIHSSLRITTGVVDTPTDWLLLADNGNQRLFGRYWDGVWTMPSLTWTGGALNEDAIAQTAAWRNVDLVPLSTAVLQNDSAQDIAFLGLAGSVPGCLQVVAGWKQDDWTSVATVAGMAEIQETTSTAGNDAGQVWDRRELQGSGTSDLTAGSFVVTGGASAISRAISAQFRPAAYLTEETDTITPDQNVPWLKSVTRPFLSTELFMCCGSTLDCNEQYVSLLWSPTVTRDTRVTLNPIVNRTFPVAVTDIPLGRQWTMRLRTKGTDAFKDIDFLTASGSFLFLQVPTDCECEGEPKVRGGYLVVLEIEATWESWGDGAQWQIEVAEIAAPGPDVVYADAVWQTVFSQFGSWQAVKDNNATWADVKALLPDPAEVIVP